MKTSKENKVSLERVCPVVLDLDDEAGYFSVLDCPDGKIRLYYRGRGRGKETHVRTSNDGITFSRSKIIFRKSSICHNFSPFLHNGEYYAVGGKGNEKGKKRHSKGLYLLHSEDGVSWDLVKEGPIISLNHPGLIRAPFDLAAEFDSSISCVPYGDRFYLYFRANIGKGVRAIQFASSDDLVHWSEIKLVRFNTGYDVDLKYNFYGPYFFNFEDRVMGFIPCFFDGVNGFIGVFEPDDNLGTWNFTGWFNKAPLPVSVERNQSFPVKGIIRNRQNPDIVHYYIHDNYFKAYPNEPVSLNLHIHKKHMRPGIISRLVATNPNIIRLYISGKLAQIFQA